MKSHISKIAAMVLVASTSYGANFTTIGQLSSSIGGAGVAVKNSPYSIYYNPALLGVGEKSGIGISTGLNYTENNLSNNIDTLSNLNIDDLANKVTVTGASTVTVTNNADLIEIQESIKSLAEGNRFSIGPSVAITAEFGNIGVGVIVQGSANASAVFDGDRTEFIFEDSGFYVKYDPVTQTATTSSLSEYNAKSLEKGLDATKIKVNGLILSEIPIGYGTQIEADFGNWYLGGSLKVLSGTTYNSESKLSDDEFADDITDSAITTAGFGIDLGIYIEPNAVEGLGLGLVAKNINTPKFEVQNSDDLKLEPQIRAGLAYDIFENLTFAIDYDVTKNDIYVEDLQSQYLGGGINFHPGDSFSLRAGIMQDLENDDLGSILTGGLSLGLFGATIDLGAQVSTETSKTSSGDDMPKYLQANLGLNIVW